MHLVCQAAMLLQHTKAGEPLKCLLQCQFSEKVASQKKCLVKKWPVKKNGGYSIAINCVSLSD